MVLAGAAKLKVEPGAAAVVVVVPNPPNVPVLVEPKLNPVAGAAAVVVAAPKPGAVRVPNPDEAVVVVAAGPKPNAVDAVVLGPNEPNENPDVSSQEHRECYEMLGVVTVTLQL